MLRDSEAGDGLRALQRIQLGFRPDLILLDMYLPLVDGGDFATELRLAGVDLPILVITADANPRGCARAVGAVGYRQKPFDVLQFLAAT